MEKYISASVVVEYLERVIFGADKKIEKWVDAIPAADVRPVVRGEWIWPDTPRDRPYCSKCLNDAFWDADYGFVTANFCPNCGADMREDGKDG